ncbi:TPA: PD-(D/E)XK motif protein [Vibrio diabolicus]
MMINFEEKWDEVNISSRKNIRIRISAEHKLDLFIGYSENGNRYFEFGSESSVINQEELPIFENITLLICVSNGICNLRITLEDNSLKDLFTIIISDLVNASLEANTIEGAAKIFINRLFRWAELLEERHRRGLTFSEQLGLYGELFYLERLISQKKIHIGTLINSWRGPEGDCRDIDLENTSIEIKTALTTAKNVLKISSLDQLDNDDKALVIARIQLSASDEGLTFSKLIGNIKSHIDSSYLVFLEFMRKLYLSGYDPNGEYVSNSYLMSSLKFYEVRENFPRLIPGNVNPAIRSAKYEIECNMLAEYEIQESSLENTIYGQ